MRGLKITEEAGELAAEILKLVGEKGRRGKTEREIREHLWLEAVDCAIMSMDILTHTGATPADVSRIFNSQLAKWESKMFTERTTKKK